MLTYHQLHDRQKSAVGRLKKHLWPRDYHPEIKARSASVFVDSGAHSLYNIHVLKHRERKGEHGRLLAKPPVRWSQGDFSYYDLSRGSEFRQYCDAYARFMRRMIPEGIICANVDAISNPDLTWEIQRYFEEEHGVQPIPIVHYGTPMDYVDRYIEAGRYSLLGVGGLGQGVSRHEYFSWADIFFSHICPESNGFLPVIKTHGFAMTSWELICRYPWWSVDSATWVKLSAYGWLYIPRKREGDWDFNAPPLMVNFSFRSPRLKERQKHFKNVPPLLQRDCVSWLEHLGLGMGSVTDDGEVEVVGVSSHHRARSFANLQYLKDLEASRPEWPYPLDRRLVQGVTVGYQRGFGL